MKRFILLFLLLMFIPTIKTNAYCKNSEIARYKKLASNINTSFEYKEADGEIKFNVTLTNLNKELYIVDVLNNKTYQYKDDEITISSYTSGQNIKYNVYATNDECSDLLYTIRINLPQYNKYYNDPVCKDIEDYIYCQKWQGHNYDHDTFLKKVEDYKKSLEVEEIPEEAEDIEDHTIFDIIIDIFVGYYYIILPTIIVVCAIIIYRVNKKSDIYN